MRKLLWIDEDVGFTQMVTNYLSVWGFQIDVRKAPPSPEEDLALYHGLVWDFTFSQRQDTAVLKDLRQRPSSSQLPVILLFSRSMTLEERLFMNEHRITHLPKWSKLWTLLEKIQENID